MFNPDLAEGGKLAVLRKDNSILTGAVAACRRTSGKHSCLLQDLAAC